MYVINNNNRWYITDILEILILSDHDISIILDTWYSAVLVVLIKDGGGW